MSDLPSQVVKELCIKNDHSWLLDDKFDGLAYKTETTSKRGKYVITVKYKRKCYFCPYWEIVSI